MVFIGYPIMQNEKLSLLMDGELVEDTTFLRSLSSSKEMQENWHRYHIIRGALRGSVHNCALNLDITSQVAAAIANDEIEPLYEDQPLPENISKPKSKNMLWLKLGDVVSRITQVGLAACVTLVVIAGVQYYGGEQADGTQVIPVLNTMPIGINVSPVGGPLTLEKTEPDVTNSQLDQEQYEKIHLLLQDYELQKRINASR